MTVWAEGGKKKVENKEKTIFCHWDKGFRKLKTEG